MKHKDLKVGMRVKVVLSSQPMYHGSNFDWTYNECEGKVNEIDHENCNLTVEVEFDNGHFDWGNHNSLVQIEKPVDKESIHDKLDKIEQLIEEIREAL